MPGVLGGLDPKISVWMRLAATPPVPKPDGKVVHKRGRAAQIKISVVPDPKFLDRLHIQASRSVKIDSQPVSRTWGGVADMAVAAGQSLEEGVSAGERVLIAVAGSVCPPDLPRRGPGGQCMEHAEHRGCVAEARRRIRCPAECRRGREAAA
jgi:hypothetical protein